MAMNVELREKPRVFEVWVGENSIGEVISYKDDEAEDGADADLYEAFLYEVGEEENRELGWYKTLRIAAQHVLEYAHGEGCKIDAIKKRKV